MPEKCVTCNNISVHGLSYKNGDTDNGWVGTYCNHCFVKKLRGMASVWAKSGVYC